MYNIEQLGCKECGRVRKNVSIDWNPNDFPDRNPCICSNPPNPFYKFYPCEKNRDHDAWRPRGQEECQLCEDRRRSVSIQQLGLKENGQSVKIPDNSNVTQPSMIEIMNHVAEKAEQEKQEQKARELRIIQLLEQLANQKQPLEDHEMIYK